MKISELIVELESVKAELGDIEVKTPIPETEHHYGGDFEVTGLYVHTESWGAHDSYVVLEVT